MLVAVTAAVVLPVVVVTVVVVTATGDWLSPSRLR